MIIKKANTLFKNDDYQNALILYKQAIKEMPELEYSILFNIAQCEKKILAKTSITNIDMSNKVIEILSFDLEASMKKGFELPDFKVIQIFLIGVTSCNYTEEVLIASLKCGLSSPYQVKLLQYLSKILNRLGLDGELSKVSTGLNLATFIKLANDRTYWLLNRKLVEKLIEPYFNNDSRLHNLLFCGDEEKNHNFSWKSLNKSSSIKGNNITNLGSIAFGTILLNEQKFIGLSLFQHYNYCNKWVLVEGTCLGYPTRKVTEDGFSKDKTTDIIELFPDPSNKILYVPHGWTKVDGEDAKSELRNEYLSRISEDFLVVLDADEFYREKDLQQAFDVIKDENLFAVVLPQVHFWKQTNQYITGEYYDISHTRIYRNIPGMKYIRNHNFPEINNKYTHELAQFKFQRTQMEQKNNGFDWKEPRCYHMGFAKDYDDMRDKSDYYINRGEDVTRKSTTESRAAWFDGDLPEKCRVKNWSGDLPLVLNQFNNNL